MEFLFEYGLFLAKTITFVAAIAIVIILVISAGLKSHGQEKGHLEVKKLNEKFDDLMTSMQQVVLEEEAFKEQEKERKKAEKKLKKELKHALKSKKDSTKSTQDSLDKAFKKRIFVTDFVGDMKASQTDELRQVITAILSVATAEDEVVVRLESPGGMVHSYGLAASQLSRITKNKVPLTVCVDKVAASGGYMMACVANKIVSAPFAIIGSIGVVAQIPNFHRLLKKHDVDYELLTAGEYKRTLTLFGENTEKGRKKFMDDLEDTHVLFKEFISQHRPVVDVSAVATGEIWFGTRALDKNLIDEVGTSDEYLFSRYKDFELFEVSYVTKKSIPERMGLNMTLAIDRLLLNWWQRINNKIFST